jgi:hypothetical protein
MCGLVVSSKFLELGVWVQVLAMLFFAWYDSCVGGLGCWADAVAGCVGAGIHMTVAERKTGEPVRELTGEPVGACGAGPECQCEG